MGIRVVVTGGRHYADREAIYAILDALDAQYGIDELAHGACPYGGADILAEDWAKAREVPYRGYPAKFKRTGQKSAGPLRNIFMLDDFKPDLVVALPGGTGTAHCCSVAIQRDIRVTGPGQPARVAGA